MEKKYDRYHLSPKTGKPEPCRASKRGCNYSFHAETAEDVEAINQKELKMQFSETSTIFKKSIVPEKPEVEPVTIEEVHEALRRQKFNPEETKVVGYSLMGSAIFGLQTPKSDRDIIVIIDDDRKNIDNHKVYDDGMDSRIVSVDAFINRLYEGIPNEVEILHSGKFTFNDPQREPHLKNSHFDMYNYYNKHLSQIRKTQLNKKDYPAIGSLEEKRENKSIKCSIRFAMMAKRSRIEGRIRTEFSAPERKEFYTAYDETIRLRKDHQSKGLPVEESNEMIIEKIMSYSNEG